MITLKKKNNLALCFLLVSVVLFTCSMTAWAQTYTLDADFDLGTLVNVNHDAPDNDQFVAGDDRKNRCEHGPNTG